jgi:hypothetical protein
VEDGEEQGYLARGQEERRAENHFGDDAASGPYVYLLIINHRSHEDLRGAVPERGDVSRVFLGFIEGVLGLPKVAEPEMSILTDEVVVRLEVSVDDAPPAEVLQTAQYLPGKRLNRLASTLICWRLMGCLSFMKSWRLPGWY